MANKRGKKMNNIQQEAAQLLKDLDIKKLKDEAKRTDILLQQLLQKLMLTYVVDITQQVALKQEDATSTYPNDLISSLKIISDLYLKMKEINKTAQTAGDFDRNGYVF